MQVHFSFTSRRSAGASLVLTALAIAVSSVPAQDQSESIKRSAVALDGYCPVCIVDMKEWVAGSPAYTAEYDGAVYRFPSEQVREKFLSNPTRYVPALGGDCAVCYARGGKRVPGSVYFTAFHRQRLYLFPDEKQKQAFVDDPAAFADVDLAYDGNCAVCQVEMNKGVPGKPEFTAHHNGFRYLFPAEEQRKMFLENTAKYAVATPQAEESVSATTPPGEGEPVSIGGKSACAFCEYGLKPLGSDELGLAIVTDEGDIYVVEDAHELYPEVYEGRFEGLQLKVTGVPLKREGRTIWLKPSNLENLTPGS